MVKTLGQYIKEQRKVKKLSKKDLAKKINCSKIVINSIEESSIVFLMQHMRNIILTLDLTIPNILKETTWQNEVFLYQAMYPEYKERYSFQNLNKQQSIKKLHDIFFPKQKDPIYDLIEKQHKLNKIYKV